ncbi:DNA gyrase inhibitor YacG [Sinirhodobacter populi]|uniref:DNA gyrase inhibitor YacG n=1 Tax=Paenirhodobacter populi TaxID=2306993 RepID=A0A443KIG6_9RHOB|nr:DNA gyrase inhibitor YacG [Sinirhodobacter populi]RWR32549.1 DNA gyrase inhibitor YacG [Sinirhodobacter populi]
MSCPICHKETDPKYRPFCSKRCADIDLAKWLNGSYVIPGDLAEEEDRALDGPPGGGDPIQ